ncbi:hypothetical protein ANME2D_00892 [Candidatus Methanoperedens nitroreducens]|uniref:Uncharacterized protein n=1 Tax=Candidatus Methanoperedens nitratireducens TaxID=1392998 RepID=A0A062VAY7_9EURY|nr:hypothetical protein [Candidatus Methanoperedens nitroreducens]KCZ72465.1 hypothetical protein ANME2D_00892 [Candidatus Methanoperedens nitroreducens]MDJ1423601.1 hypothetical protein [Candidatus Methanoperedens sp.]
MSFLLDPPALFITGIAFYYVGNKWGLVKLVRIAISLFIVLSFVFFSLLLYYDALPCFLPVICNNLSGSEFMFHSNITGIYKKDVPLVAVILLFSLYPLWYYLGYASARKFSKRGSK